MTDSLKYRQFRMTAAIALISSSVVAYQLFLMHFLSIVQWHYFAFLVISVAMLGYGAAGTTLSLFKSKFINNDSFLLPFLMISCGLTMTMAVQLSQIAPLRFDSYRLLAEPGHIGRLVINYILYLVPFYFGGLVIGLIYTKYTSRIGLYYCADLIGAGLGGIIIILLFWHLYPQYISNIISLLPISAGVLMITAKKRYLLFYAFLGVLFLFIRHKNPVTINYSEFKSISKSLNLPASETEYEKNSPYGFVQVVSSPVTRYAPGLSLNCPYEVPVCKNIFLNGNWYSSAIPSEKNMSEHFLDYTTISLPWYLEKRNNIMIINSGAGAEVSHALSHLPENVDAIEPNRIIVSLMQSQLARFSDSVYIRPNVRILNYQPRTYLQQTDSLYDLIFLPLVGSFGGTMGTGAMNEEYLLTSEAFTAMYNRLTETGIISVSCWFDYPARTSLRLAAIIKKGLQEAGTDNPQNHIAVIKSWGIISFYVKHKTFTPQDTLLIHEFCDSRGFEPVCLPFPELTDTTHIDHLICNILHSKTKELISDYDFRIYPVTDNRPYFSQFLRWKYIIKTIRQLGQNPASYTELGYLIVIFAAIQSLFLAFLLIIIPLFRLTVSGKHFFWIILLFGGIGIGYMFMEMIFIKLFLLYLGHPVYSATVTISVMLISSGTGSIITPKIRANPGNLKKIILLVIILLLSFTLLYSFILPSVLHFSFMLRILFTSVTVIIPSFFMGMIMPLGLRLVSSKDEQQVPWAWGINGCMSVVSLALASVIAVECGFVVLILLAACAYFLSFTGLLIVKH